MADGVVDAPAGEIASAPAPGAPVGSSAPSGAAGTSPDPSSAGAGTSAAAPVYTYKEDRSKWVPSEVVRERTERLRAIERDLDIERRRVAALSGVTPPTPPEDPGTTAVKQQLYQIFPWAKKLDGLSPEQIEKLVSLDPAALQSSAEQVWAAHGSRMLDHLATKLKDVYGGAELQPRAVSRVQQLFANELDADPDARSRYERGDLSVIDDFVKEYTAGFLEPYRRPTQVATQQRITGASRLPRGGAGSAIAAGPVQPTVKPSDGDAFHKAAFARFKQGGG